MNWRVLGEQAPEAACLLAVAVAVADADVVRLLAGLTVRVGRSCTPDY